MSSLYKLVALASSAYFIGGGVFLLTQLDQLEYHFYKYLNFTEYAFDAFEAFVVLSGLMLVFSGIYGLIILAVTQNTRAKSVITASTLFYTFVHVASRFSSAFYIDTLVLGASVRNYQRLCPFNYLHMTMGISAVGVFLCFITFMLHIIATDGPTTQPVSTKATEKKAD